MTSYRNHGGTITVDPVYMESKADIADGANELFTKTGNKCKFLLRVRDYGKERLLTIVTL